MANTRDILGDQETLDALVNGTLTELEEDGITSLPQYALHRNTHIETLKFPNVTSISQEAFYGCSALKHLVLGSSTKCSLKNATAFENTPIANGKGAVYVQEDLVDTYKADSYWKKYLIASVADYPLNDLSKIRDSWEQIVASVGNGTYSTKYNVGDTKKISINGVDVYMVLIAKDADTLADGSGTAKTTWLSDELFTTHKMNNTDTKTNSWAQSEMRTWLRETILPTLDSTIQSNIKEVTKTYRDGATGSTLSIADTVWIPSALEVFGNDSSYESAGCNYKSFFSSNDVRTKRLLSGLESGWLLRSAPNAYNYYMVKDSGMVSSYGTSTSDYGVALGFCI